MEVDATLNSFYNQSEGGSSPSAMYQNDQYSHFVDGETSSLTGILKLNYFS